MFVLRLLLFVMLFQAVRCRGYWKCESGDCSSGTAKLSTRYCDQYEGGVENGEPKGYGKFTYSGNKCPEPGFYRLEPEGLVYEGNWGIWKHGYNRLIGEGKIIYPNGAAYGGTFDGDDAPKGKGWVVLPGQKKVEGIWKRRRLCTSGDCMNGPGVHYYVGSVSYRSETEFKNGVSSGKCKMDYFRLIEGNPLKTLRYSSVGECTDLLFSGKVVDCDKNEPELCRKIMKK
ncbi:MAG TPA: hypothetical protein PK683_17960, partial [Leptospiraceae bacterium]|nr:hypothetical protein [Leptospiraceae bacterium]